MSKTILITGGAGFIGSNLALQLVSEGYTVKILDLLSPQIHGQNPEQNSPLFKNILGKVTFLQGDICNANDVLNAIEGVEIIFHFAAETGTGQSMYQVAKYTHTNTYGTSVLVDVLANHAHGIKKIILSSSRAVYGEGKYQNSTGKIVYPRARQLEWLKKGIFEMTDVCGNILQPLPTDEKALLQPVSIYGLTKVQQEDILRMACKTNGIKFTILRFQNVYGEGQSLKNPYTGILSIFSTLIKSGKEINIFEDGKPARDFVHISDVVESCKRCMDRTSTDDQIINIGTGISSTVLQIAENLNKLYHKNTPLRISGDYRLGDIRYNVADVSTMKNLLGFSPSKTIEQGLKDFVTWVENQEIEDILYENSLDEMRKKGLIIKI